MRLTLVLMLIFIIFEVFLFFFNHNWGLKYFGAVRPQLRINAKHLFYNSPQLDRVLLWDALDLASAHSLEQSLHTGSLERRLERYHFIKNATERPHVAFDVVRLVFPNFWTGIVWGACLSKVKSFLCCNFTDIHITQFDTIILIQEDIGAL